MAVYIFFLPPAKTRTVSKMIHILSSPVAVTGINRAADGCTTCTVAGHKFTRWYSLFTRLSTSDTSPPEDDL